MLVVHDRPFALPYRRTRDDPAARAPGQYTRARLLRLSLRTLLALGVLAILTTVLGRTLGLRNPLFVGSELALLIAMFVVSRYVLPLLERHDRGAAGEEHVGGLLGQLASDEGWSVFHDARLSHGNVDHVLVGPAGLFAVETKSNPGPVHVRSLHPAVLRQVREECDALERAVGTPAEPLLVFSRAWIDKPLTRRRGVRVVPARMLLGHLRRRPATLTPEQVSELRARVLAALSAAAAQR